MSEMSWKSVIFNGLVIGIISGFLIVSIGTMFNQFKDKPEKNPVVRLPGNLQPLRKDESRIVIYNMLSPDGSRNGYVTVTGKEVRADVFNCVLSDFSAEDSVVTIK